MMNKYISMRYEIELNNMVETFNGYYKFKILRDVLKNKQYEPIKEYLLIYIESYNKVIPVFMDIIVKGHNEAFQHIYDIFFDIYMKMFRGRLAELELKLKYKYGKNCFFINIEELYRKKYVDNFKNDILDYWNESKIGDQLVEDRDFIKMFDEIHDYALVKQKNIFVIKLRKLKYLYRGARENHFGDYERMIPKSEYCRNNRWNPDGIEFLYLGCDYKCSTNENMNIIQRTCCEELRIKKGQDVTLCRFKYTNPEAKLLNLCIDDTYVNEELRKLDNILYDKLEKFKHDEKIMLHIIALLKQNDREELERYIKIKTKSISEKKNIERYVSTLLISNIVDAIFKPVDEIEVPELKAYIPFRLFSVYLMRKGYQGIIYKSTRMDLIGQEGKNVALFNKNDATYWENTMEVYHCGEEGYSKININ